MHTTIRTALVACFYCRTKRTIETLVCTEDGLFTGSIVALVTPMDEKGKVCRSSLKKLIDYHVASGIGDRFCWHHR